NAQIHPQVAGLINLETDRLISRYCHLHPGVDPKELEELLTTRPTHFYWGGSDLFNVTTTEGLRQMVVIETNSCPSGQKSMPLTSEPQEQGGYRLLIQETFRALLDQHKRRLPTGDLAVIFDKNTMEASGYAAAMADEFQEPVLLAEYYDGDPDPPARFDASGILHVRAPEGDWRPIRAAFRYVTQRPWTRIPPLTRTVILNPVIACLSGGRNKMVAAKAYELFNAHLDGSGLTIHTPETIRDVSFNELPLWVARFGGHAVIKIPYSNAGQGVFTITNEDELAEFMEIEQRYEQFVVQSLIGNYGWSSRGSHGRLYHVGTVPDRRRQIFAADLRCMVAWTSGGYRPVAIYARRARAPLSEKLTDEVSSWDMLGTNLSIKNEDGSWGSDTNRLLLMDRRDFNKLGLGLDDLIEAFIQTVLSVTAIDRLARSLVTRKGRFRSKLFRSLNDDAALLREIVPG
ncbi:MAG: hypothetical protein KC636_25735, partial [Myxococcales bacterium]|nr:hypothetical protein [Myxococcales bacterium]